MQNYRDLKVWEKSHKLTLEVYKITKAFPSSETYGLTSQLRRSVSSIPTNIAEGCGRHTALDFANFLQNSLGSANEVDYLLLLSKDLEYLDATKFIELETKINEIRAMLIALIKKVRGVQATYNL
ncbi:MAG TPA: four helix bundle protein [Cytophagaceae bacterium]